MKFSNNFLYQFKTQDSQYQSILKMAQQNISNCQLAFFTTSGALVSYQLSGTGEQWREELSYFLIQHSSLLQDNQDLFLRKIIFSNTLYNKRLQNIKLQRLQKYIVFKSQFCELFPSFEQNPYTYYSKLLQWFDSKKPTKTLIFAYKILVWSLATRGIEH